jgi:CBS domain containing-hemolysin-like protein
MSIKRRLEALEKKHGINENGRVESIHALPDETDAEAIAREGVADGSWVFRNLDDPAVKYNILDTFFTADKDTYEEAKPALEGLIEKLDKDILGLPKYRKRVMVRNLYELSNFERQLLIKTETTPLLASGYLFDRLRRMPAGTRMDVTGTMTKIRDVDGEAIEALQIQEINR